MRIDAKGMHYRELNKIIRNAIISGEKEFVLDNVNGQRYIGDGLDDNIKIIINGTPGNDLAAFMNGPTIIVNANAQDGIANTMNDGKIIIHGNVGDIIGYGMRGGKLYIKGNVGYRVGIHIKEYKDKMPIIIIGGCAGDFLGEYMAGGVLIVLGINGNEKIVGNYVGTGMHGGVMYIRGDIDPFNVGKEVSIVKLNDKDKKILSSYLKEYCECFEIDYNEVMSKEFTKLMPLSHRPYGNLYVY